MCLAAFAFDAHPRWRFVVAANRDEFHARPAAPLTWWPPESHGIAHVAPPTQPTVLAGRDLQAGGTWLGLARDGRFALLTNVRSPRPARVDAPSRGHLPVQWLQGQPLPKLWQSVTGVQYNPFNLVVADVAARRAWWLHPDQPAPQPMAAGFHGLSNAELGTPWPKVVTLQSRLEGAVRRCEHVDDLAAALFSALADDQRAPDARLPSTGVPLELERTLSSAFIRAPERGYGTRCSTVVIGEQHADGRCETRVIERSFDVDGAVLDTHDETIAAWPPASRST